MKQMVDLHRDFPLALKNILRLFPNNPKSRIYTLGTNNMEYASESMSSWQRIVHMRSIAKHFLCVTED